MNVWPMVETERLAPAAGAVTYTDAEWQMSTPCPGWRVRELIAHLAQYGNPPWPPIAFARAGFNRDRFVADVAIRIAAAHTDAGLIARLRDRAGSRWRPPGVSAEGMLLDTIVHAWDIRTSLGRAVRARPDDHYVRALDYAVVAGNILRSRKRVRGLRLTATDLAWQHGDGPGIVGPAEAILAALTGRAGALDALDGDGVEVLRSRCP